MSLVEHVDAVRRVERKAVGARQLDQPRARDVPGEITAEVESIVSIVAAVQDQCRHGYRGQDRAHVQVEDPSVHPRRGARRHREALYADKPGLHTGILREAGRGQREDRRVLTPVLPVAFDQLLGGGVRHPDGIVRRAPPAREGVDQDQRRDALGVARGQHDRHRPAFGVADDGSAARAGRIQRGQRIVHPLLERRQRVERHRTGHAGAALVEADHAAAAGQALVVQRAAGLVPHRVDVGRPAGDEQDVALAFAEGLVRDVAPVRRCVAGLRTLHATRDRCGCGCP